MVTSVSYTHLAENIKDKFFQIPDVKKVELVGVQPEKIYIQMSNAKLAQLGIPINTLASTIQAETAVTPVSYTHLDVYKRQVPATVKILPLEWILTSKRLCLPACLLSITSTPRLSAVSAALT